MAHSADLSGVNTAAAYDRFAAVSRATRDAAAAADIRFFRRTYATQGAKAFALRNADRVKSLGTFIAPDFASIQMYTRLRDVELELGPETAKIALLPRSMTKLVISLRTMRIDWENFRPLCCLQELQVYKSYSTGDDSFATALPLLRVFHLTLTMHGLHYVALETSAKVVMPHLVELKISHTKIVHLDLRFVSALKRLSLVECTFSTVSAACRTMRLEFCFMREGRVLVTPNLRSLFVFLGGQHKLDGSRCQHALSIVCKDSSVEWVGARPIVKNLSEVV